MSIDPSVCFTVPLRDLGADASAFRGILAPAVRASTTQGVTAQFLERAADYDERYRNHAHFRVLLDNSFACLEHAPDPRLILDIGSGSGNSVIPLLERFPAAFVVATDISPQLLAILRDHLAAVPRYAGRFALVCVDAVDARLRRAVFDLAVGAAILHHVLEPERVIAICRHTLRPGGTAVFLEPFAMGHAVLALAYRAIVEEADRLGEDGAGLAMLRHLRADYAARRRDRDDPRFLEMDDKWMFTRAFFEAEARRGSWYDCVVYPIHGHEAPLADQTRINLRLGGDLDVTALPDWAWAELAAWEAAFAPETRRDLVFECAVVMRSWPGGPQAGDARAGWWYDAGAPGRGFFIAIDGAVASVTCCHYDADGEPVWHVAGPAPWHDDTMHAAARPFGTPAADGDDLALRFPGAARMEIRWGARELVLEPQHPQSVGWNGGMGSERGGAWIEDADLPAVRAVVEVLDGHVFAALLTAQTWYVTVAATRRVDVYQGEWLRFSGGQALDGPYRAPHDPARCGSARLLWTDTDRLVVQMPGGRHAVLRRMEA